MGNVASNLYRDSYLLVITRRSARVEAVLVMVIGIMLMNGFLKIWREEEHKPRPYISWSR